MVLFPAAVDDDLETLERQRGFNVRLFNPQKPGWASEGDLRGLQWEARDPEHCQRPPLVSKLAKRKDPCWSTGMTKPPEAVTEGWRRAEPLQPAAGFC
jgi:hypothetical protein